MSDNRSKRTESIRVREPSTDEPDEVAGHKWEPHTTEQDERLATPAPPPPPPRETRAAE